MVMTGIAAIKSKGNIVGEVWRRLKLGEEVCHIVFGPYGLHVQYTAQDAHSSSRVYRQLTSPDITPLLSPPVPSPPTPPTI